MAFASKKRDIPMINERIRFERLQLITDEGENKGVIGRQDALNLARERGLDLVLISERGSQGVPVAKIVDYGKMLYERKKQQADAKKKQHVIQVKEVKFRPKIGEHDFDTKMNKALAFLRSGKRVKFTLTFRGREMAMKRERGTEFFERLSTVLVASDVGSQLTCEKDTTMGNMWSRICYIKPSKGGASTPKLGSLRLLSKGLRPQGKAGAGCGLEVIGW